MFLAGFLCCAAVAVLLAVLSLWLRCGRIGCAVAVLAAVMLCAGYAVGCVFLAILLKINNLQRFSKHFLGVNDSQLSSHPLAIPPSRSVFALEN